MTIYIDVYFLKNIIFNILLLYLTSLIIRKKFKLYRGIIAASIGGIYAIVALYSSNIFNSAILKILVSVIMLAITFGKKEVSVNLSSYFVLAYTIAGIIASLLNANSQVIMIMFALSTIIIFYLYKKNQRHNEYYEIYIELLPNEIELIAKLDTGNELRDSIFGDAVIVVSEERIKNKLDEELLEILNNERLEISDRYKNRIKLISYKTISGEGIKIGIKIDKVIISTENKNIESKAIMILSEKKFKNYDALIGNNLLEGGFEYEDNSFNKIKNKGII